MSDLNRPKGCFPLAFGSTIEITLANKDVAYQSACSNIQENLPKNHCWPDEHWREDPEIQLFFYRPITPRTTWTTIVPSLLPRVTWESLAAEWLLFKWIHIFAIVMAISFAIAYPIHYLFYYLLGPGAASLCTYDEICAGFMEMPEYHRMASDWAIWEPVLRLLVEFFAVEAVFALGVTRVAAYARERLSCRIEAVTTVPKV